MAIFNRKRRPEAEESGPAPRAVMASAVPLTGPEAKRYAAARAKQTAEQWQKDAWYFYDGIGELSAPTNWIANAVSKADLFGAEIDPATGLVTGPTEDTRAQQAAALCLGGAAKRAQLQFILAVCWQIPGEAYVVVRGRSAVQGVPQPDEWLVLSGQKVVPKSAMWTYEDPVTLEWVTLGGSDRLIRVWSPHPNDQSKANSAVRAALPVLREIEKASMNLASVLDSRIASNGVWIIPQEIDLPGRGDDETNAERFSDMLLEAASAGIAAPGTAAAQVPVIAEVPQEMIEALVSGRMYPQTDMDQSVITLRQDDMGRLASALDMPKETAEGSMSGMNHWGSWQVEETTYKLFIEPLLDRVGDALTEFWYRPVLRAMGIQDAERHTLAWDTTGIVSRPDATEDMNWLYENGLISDDYRRQASGVPEDAMPTEDESQMRRLERIVMGAPTLAADPEIAQRLFGFEIAPEAAGVSTTDAGQIEGAPAIPEGTGDGTGARALPTAPASTDDAPDGLVAAAELIVFDALSRAGGRLLTREHRGQFASTPRHELHTVIRAAAGDVNRLLADSFQFCDNVADAYGLDRERFRSRIREYAGALLAHGVPHGRTGLTAVLRTIR